MGGQQELTGVKRTDAPGRGGLLQKLGGRGHLRGAHRGRSWAAWWWSRAGDRETDWRRLLLVDTKLGTERNDEECGKGL
jgi:hypothetical protein